MSLSSSQTRALRTLLAALLLALAGESLAGPLPPPPPAACSTGSISVGDALINTPTGGDKDFFAIPPGPPNIMFLLGNNDTMQDYVVPLPSAGAATGCDDASLTNPATNPIAASFNPASPDPEVNGARPVDPDPDFTGATLQFFDPALYFVSFHNRLPLEGTHTPWSLDNSFRATVGDAAPGSACDRWGMGATDRAACVSCLTRKGWYRWTRDSAARSRWVVSGRVLNVLPPKLVVARKVVKDTIQTVANVRLGVATYGPHRGLYDPPELLHPVKPSCNRAFPILEQGDLTQARNDINKQINLMTFVNAERSIGEALFGLGGYFSSQKADGKWGRWFDGLSGVPSGYPGRSDWTDGATTWTKQGSPWEAGGNEKSVCWPCQSTAIIVLTDGVPLNDNSVPVSRILQMLKLRGARHPDGTLLTFDPNTGTPGGVNYCDKFGGTKVGCDAIAAGPLGPDVTNKNFMDDVAFFLSHVDLRDDYGGDEGLDSGQRVRTYTIGFGDNSPMLKSIASAGKGKFYGADNGDQLRDALVRAINDVKETSTSFSSSNLTPVQTGGQQFSAYVPRFTPRNDRPYEGHLFRFQYFSEFVEGCDAKKAAQQGGDPADLDRDGRCDGVFLLDVPAGYAPGAVPPSSAYRDTNIVQENKDGVWVKAKTATVDSATGKLVGGQPAQPFWDANTVLGTRSASQACPGPGLATSGGRCIYTTLDRNSDGRLDDRDNPPVEFIRANEPLLRPYLLSGGDGACVEVYAKLGLNWTGSAADQQKCSETIIDFVRGMDVFDLDGDKNLTENRPCADDTGKGCLLGDIFHSSPIVVDPPVDPLLCDLGLHNQCVRTLYLDYAAAGRPPVGEQPCSASSGKPCYAATPMSPPLDLAKGDYGAYGRYASTWANRERFVLVGSNDGLLHAFHAGSPIPLKPKESAIDDLYDLGTGQEMWAYVPPDLLAKLGLLVKGHQYMVDGTPMVRDVWRDGSGTQGGTRNVKDEGEFHTVAILSERGGGSRYVALDVTDPWAMVRGGGNAFRWMWPNANDPESTEVGESWVNFAPKPPPIGPVRLAAANTRGWDERWIVMLNGGYSADLTRGRGVYMLDAWSGEKLWSFTPPSGASDAYGAVRSRLMPVAAAVSLVDIGKAEGVRHDADGFFDTATVGDVGGQLWTFRFHQPGELGAGGVTNWYGARGLEMSREDVGPSAPRDFTNRQPFFNIASNTLQPETGWMRTFAGTGDRQNLRDTEATGCSPSNLLACARLRCNADLTVSSNVNGLSTRHRLAFTAGALTTNARTTTGAVAPAPTCSGSKLGIDGFTLSCPAGSSLATNPWVAPPFTVQSQCTNASGVYGCTVSSGDMDVKGSLAPNTASMPKNRFFGYQAYGGDRRFDELGAALGYDAVRVSDRSSSCGATNGCALQDVSIPSGAFVTVTGPDGKAQRVIPPNYPFQKAGALAPGWFIPYEALDEKTGAGSAVLGGIVFWPSLLVEGPQTGPCTSTQGDLGRSWQADIVTGAPDQAEGFKVPGVNGPVGIQPYKQRTVSAPPPEPAQIISLSKNGEIRYGVSVIEPGAKPAQETLRSRSELASDVYWLEVPRGVHQCRHVDSRACR